MSEEVFNTLTGHRSIREYEDKELEDEKIEKIVKAGRQAPFVSQMYSVIMEKGDDIPFGAPVMFTICVDINKLEVVMEKRDWEITTNDMTLLLFGIQDAAYMAQNMVVASESMGLGTCYLGSPIRTAENLKEKYGLPDKVLPVVKLVVGYPAEDPPTRPRYPLDFVLFEEEYPELSEQQIEEAVDAMDEGYLEEDYYRKLDAKISLTGEEEDEFSYGDYSWTEHISRKWGQWYPDLDEQLEILEACGFDIKCGDE
ncbi:MAG: nitroreductase family protein [Thermoplasmata archaeon]